MLIDQIQCDAESPQCNWCKHHNLACTYSRLADMGARSQGRGRGSQSHADDRQYILSSHGHGKAKGL